MASCQLPRLEERHPFRKCLLFLSSCRSSYLYYCIRHLHLPHPGEYRQSQFFLNKIGCGVTGRPELRHQTGYSRKCGGATYQPLGLNKASQPWEHTFHQAAIRKSVPDPCAAPVNEHPYTISDSSSCPVAAPKCAPWTSLEERCWRSRVCSLPSWRWVTQALMSNPRTASSVKEII